MRPKQETQSVINTNESMLQIVHDLNFIRDSLIEVALMLRESHFLRESNQNSDANAYLKELIGKSKNK
jgi:hypothetical protein